MSPLWWTRVLCIGSLGLDVEAVQQLLGLKQTGVYDYDTAAAVRGMQMMQRVDPTGEVDEATAVILGPRANDESPPDWYHDAPIRPGDEDYPPIGEAAVRRLQGQYGFSPTGVVDQQTALILGAIGVERALY